MVSISSQPSMERSDCLNDGSFGPAVVGCRDDFDFTKLFEQSMLSIAPSSLFVILAVLRVAYLYRRPIVVNGSWRFQQFKFAAIGCYVSLQIAILVLACTSKHNERTAIPASVLSLLAATLVLVISVFEHPRTLKPSTLLSVYLFFTLLFDIAQSRTQWLSSRHSPQTKVFTASIAAKLSVLLVEAQSKTRWIKATPGQPQNPEATSNIFSRSVFFWLNQLLFRGYQEPLSADSLYALDKSLLAERHADLFWDEFQRRRAKSKTKTTKGQAILLSVATTLKWPFLVPMIPRLAVTAFSFSQPFLINALLKHLRKDSTKASVNAGYGFIGAAIIIYTGLAVSTGFYGYFYQRALTKLRSCLVTVIYRTTIRKAAKQDGNTSAITLMNSDVSLIQGGMRDLHECWASIIEIGMASWLLYRQIGVAFIAPILVILACTGLTLIIARFADKRQGTWMSLLQKRVALTSSIIPSLPAIKMSGLSYQTGRLVQTCRDREIAGAKRFRIITTVSAVVAFAPLLLSPVATFAFSAGSLNIEVAFTALSWINLLCQPLTQLFQSVPQLIAALTCFHRVEAFLESELHHEGQPVAVEEVETAKSKSSSEENVDDAAFVNDEPCRLKVQSGKFGWEKDTWVLEEINFSIKPSSLTMITGGMAAGKSTLCKALLKEVPFATGSVHWHGHAKSRVAYCDQDPFLLNSTVRENIVGFGIYDASWYEEVVRCCHLSSDLASLPKGDQTRVGSKGLALSGGQRKRICLARAIYSRPDVTILDDVLSGMDSRTEDLIVRDVMGPDGLFRKIGTTIVLSTQPTRNLQLADRIIILHDKTMLRQTTPVEMNSSKDAYIKEIELEMRNSTGQRSSQNQETATMFNATPQSEENNEEITNSRKPPSISDVENYKFYFTAIGASMLLPFGLVGIGFAFLYNFSTVWLEFWQNSRYGPGQLSFYLGLYFMLQIVCLLFLAAFFGYNVIVMGPRASSKLHLRALCVVLRAPLEYYTTVDAGVPTGYFSQDMSIMDNDLNGSLDNTVLTGLTAVGRAALIGIASPFVLIGYPVILLVLFFIQKFYLRTSTQLRTLQLESKEPLYKHFMETIDGLVTIRAFGWTSENIALNAALLDESQRSSYLLPILQQWLNLVLNLCVAGIATLFVVLATQLRTSAGLTGIGLVSLMSFGEMMGDLVRCYSQLQTATVALSRMRTLEKGVPNEDSDVHGSTPPDQWLTAGDVKLDRVYASYKTDVPFPGKKAVQSTVSNSHVLRDVTLSIKSGERVLICGRTGSGKSSLLLLLQGFLKPASGDVLVDKTNTRQVACPSLRNRIIALPQVPFFLQERCSVRENLEYHGKDSELDFESYKPEETQALQDEECEYALRAVGLWELMESRGGLDAELNDDALSRGQKQLFSLARAIVRIRLRQEKAMLGGGILLLDEFNNGLDVKTERAMWDVIQREFALYTIICVAHRLEGALDCNRIVTMSNGEVVEEGRPEELLRVEGGKFRDLWQKRCDAGGTNMSEVGLL